MDNVGKTHRSLLPSGRSDKFYFRFENAVTDTDLND